MRSIRAYWPYGLLILLFATLSQAAQTPGEVRITQSNHAYESPDSAFRISFPGPPTARMSETQTSFGKSEMMNVSLGTTFAFYGVTYIDFPVMMNDRYDLNVRFDAMRDSLVKSTSGRVMEDTEYFLGSHYGRSNVYESADRTTTTRAVVVGPRMYVIEVTVPGKLSTQAEKLRKANQDRIAKFFASFTILNVTQPKLAAVSLPADFGISVKDRVFSSTFFGATMTMPSGWLKVDKADADMMMELGKDSVKKSDPELSARLTDEHARLLASFSPSAPDKTLPSAHMMIMVEKAPYPNFLPMSAAKTYLTLYLDKTEKVVSEPKAIQIDGVEFAWCESFDTEAKTYNRFYTANREGMAFELLMIYRDKADLNAMLAAVQTLRFAKK